MIKSMVATSFLVSICISCTQKSGSDIEKWKQEIIEAERAFCEMAKNEGISAAFITFSADDVVVLRGNNLIKGKSALRASYESRPSGNVSLVWAPDFVDVSSSGDLGYTYGKYTYSSTDSLGKVQSSEGIFHTVWKRQADGTWKFVWD